MANKVWLQSSIHPRGIRCAWHHCRPLELFYTPLEEESISLSLPLLCAQEWHFQKRKMDRPQLQQHKQRFTGSWHLLLGAERKKKGFPACRMPKKKSMKSKGRKWRDCAVLPAPKAKIRSEAEMKRAAVWRSRLIAESFALAQRFGRRSCTRSIVSLL